MEPRSDTWLGSIACGRLKLSRQVDFKTLSCWLLSTYNWVHNVLKDYWTRPSPAPRHLYCLIQSASVIPISDPLRLSLWPSSPAVFPGPRFHPSNQRAPSDFPLLRHTCLLLPSSIPAAARRSLPTSSPGVSFSSSALQILHQPITPHTLTVF